ncbi:MAG: hypothetical protein ACXAEU_23495 [Candidatus Hodarchaeales archaeon]|jgi:signal transduction histidine kinase
MRKEEHTLLLWEDLPESVGDGLFLIPNSALDKVWKKTFELAHGNFVNDVDESKYSEEELEEVYSALDRLSAAVREPKVYNYAIRVTNEQFEGIFLKYKIITIHKKNKPIKIDKKITKIVFSGWREG